jgi:hypothetical protein
MVDLIPSVFFMSTSSLVEAFRYSFFGEGEFYFRSLGYSSMTKIATLLLGIVVFNRT